MRRVDEVSVGVAGNAYISATRAGLAVAGALLTHSTDASVSRGTSGETGSVVETGAIGAGDTDGG